jgi:Protein of unknown function (DUF2971)
MAKVQEPIVPGRLYRYRSLTRNANAVQQEIDSILKRYLFCPAFTLMNDPMEGFYRPSKVLSGKSDYKDIVREITDSKSNVGIACFTETYEDVLMWTHYAGNYTGMCLAYSTKELLAGLSDHVNLVRLAYVDEPPLIYPSQVRNAGNAATRILSQKKYNWAYEREWRVLGSVGQVTIGRVQAVKAVYFGSRVDLHHRQQILAKIQGTGIKAYMMDVDGYDHTWEPINAAAKPKKKTKLSL